MVLARNGDDLKDSWHSYRSHTKKNVMWIFAELVAKGANKLGDFAELYQEDAEHPFILDQLKQLGFYTDCLGKCNWSEPGNVISEDIAMSLVKTAKLLAGKKEIQQEEIELWVHHLKPVWKGEMEHMEHALVQWHESMVEKGLKSYSSMEEFITTGIEPRRVGQKDRGDS